VFKQIGRFFRWIWRFFVDFFKSLWRVIVSLKTAKGILALAISLTIYYGWAIAFIVIGTVFPQYRWMIGVGTGVVIFWAGPFTPFWPITLVTTIIIQRYILRDKKTQSFKEIYKQFLADREMSKEDAAFIKRIERKEEKRRKKAQIDAEVENINVDFKVEERKNDQDSTPND
jgi:hypothetical protein